MAGQVTVEGQVGRDPEIKFFDNGNCVANFPVAVDEYKREKDQMVKSGVTWFRVAVWGTDGQGVVEHVKKGSKVIVIGTLKVGVYEKDGEHIPAPEINAKVVGVVPRPVKMPDKKEDDPW
jgi:single-strand DNA-binding protein